MPTATAVYPIWHPFTQMKTAGAPLHVKRGEGAYLELADGRRIVDCISSWWVTLHGHGQKEIADAIHAQALELEHVIFAGFTHEPAEKLSTGLLKHLPGNLTRVFFSDNGSTSIEVALKMAFQYWQNIGKEGRKKFIGFEGGYHGDTLGAMSAGGSSVFWDHFRPLMFPIETVPYPHIYDGDPNREETEERSLEALEAILQDNPEQIAGIIIEPLVQGAAGMRMCSTKFLQRLREVATTYDVLLIFDEVMTGFGRTGDWFASSKAKVKPDIICLSKGISGGFLPLSVTCSTEHIYEAFLDEKLEKALFHSHSYTGNPIACAAGVASLQLLERNQDRFLDMEQRHRNLAGEYLPTRQCEKFRFCGTIAAFDLISDEANHYFNTNGPALRSKFLEAGLLLRPLGNTIYLMPPYCIDDATLTTVYATISNIIARR